MKSNVMGHTWVTIMNGDKRDGSDLGYPDMMNEE